VGAVFESRFPRSPFLDRKTNAKGLPHDFCIADHSQTDVKNLLSAVYVLL
jgi:hypothetical protein